MPPRPVRFEIPARVTRLAICLHAKAMLLSTVASSLSTVPFCSSCMQAQHAVSLCWNVTLMSFNHEIHEVFMRLHLVVAWQ